MSSQQTPRAARLLEMADTRRLDTLLVDSVLGATMAKDRRAAALAIGQVGGNGAAPRLRALLADADTTVAANAAFGLGLVRDTSAIPALETALGAPPAIATAAAWSLGVIGEPSRGVLTAALVAVRGAADRSPRVNAAIVLAASRLRPVPAPEIIALLDVRSAPGVVEYADVRVAAAYALSRTRAPAGVRPLLALAGDVGAELRAQVARALAKPATGDSLAALALTALEPLATDADPHVRINAIRSLATFAKPARAAMLRAMRDPDANVRVAAAQGFATVLDSGDATWATVWAADTGFMFRRSALASALAAREPLAAAMWATDADWRRRASVAEAAAGVPDATRLLALATPLASDADARVREQAVDAVATLADSVAYPSARALVVAALRDKDFYVRAVALAALGRRPTVSEFSAVLFSYRQSLADSGNDARIAALRVIATLWRADSTGMTPAMRDALGALAVPGDPLERAEAKGVTPLSGWPGREGTPRPASWYQQVAREIVAPAAAGRSLRAVIRTERGAITLELLPMDAPLTVFNFVSLARAGFYRNTRLHRVVPNFVAQDGDPRGDGNGGPGYAIRDELNRLRYERGAVGMALSGPDTGGSQYFLTLSPQPHLDGGYTIFARVSGGFETMDRLVQGDRILDITIQ